MNNQPNLNKLILVAALGYFVDVYDLVLFSMERVSSLTDILKNIYPTLSQELLDRLILQIGVKLMNFQMFGMLVGGIFWGILGDKKGRLSVLFGSIFVYSIANILNGMVSEPNMYALLRFISGFGLAGELGAGITLVSECMSKEKRGLGTTFVASVGLSGAVVAGVVGVIIDNWRISYIIGGIMGLILLIFRIGVSESTMFSKANTLDVKKGNLLSVFQSKTKVIKFISIIVVAMPVWYVMGILITLSPELMKAMGMVDGPKTAKLAITFAYVGITLGDISSGLLSQYFKSRKKALLCFMILTALTIVLFFTTAAISIYWFYFNIVLIGFSTGYWAVFMATASELFGTNIRSTITTSVPNFVRGSTIIINSFFYFLIQSISFSNVQAAIAVGAVVLSISFIGLYLLEETFNKDLDYLD